MNNKVIEVLDREHGKKVIEFFNSQGIYTRALTGSNTKADDRKCRYYGVINGRFEDYNLGQVENAGAEIITLPGEEKQVKTLFNFNTTKVMTVYKTKTIQVNGVEREITVAVTVAPSNLVMAGYSVKLPTDKVDVELAKKIALGRASNDRTNVNEKMYIHDSMKKKFVMFAIADNIMTKIERGHIEIKGVK